MRRMVCGLALCVLTSSAVAAGHYVELWDPPEARGMTHRVTPARRHLAHRRVRHPAFARKQHVPEYSSNLALRQRAVSDGLRPRVPDITDIPRQLTPEGNVLRVALASFQLRSLADGI